MSECHRGFKALRRESGQGTSDGGVLLINHPLGALLVTAELVLEGVVDGVSVEQCRSRLECLAPFVLSIVLECCSYSCACDLEFLAKFTLAKSVTYGVRADDEAESDGAEESAEAAWIPAASELERWYRSAARVGA